MEPRKKEQEQGTLIRWLDRELAAAYGDRVRPRRPPDPLDELILTVLSQNTNDVNRDRAYSALRGRLPSWEAVAAAPREEVEELIRTGGLARQKSERIQAMLGIIREREGGLTLRRLCRMPMAEAKEYLRSLKGVGEKTTAIVLLFSCGMPAFPVDTHILRVGKRLGIIPARATADQAHEHLRPRVPAELMYRFHINLIEHGRRVCHPRKPACRGCCLSEKCPGAGRAG